MPIAEELLPKLQEKFPGTAKAESPVPPYTTLQVPADRLVGLVSFLKSEHGFTYLDMVTAVDWSGPTNLKGYITEPNPNPFLPPEGREADIPAPAANPKIAYKDVFVVVYLLSSLDKREKVALKVETPRSAPSVPTLIPLFKAADWQEREVFDLFGVRFEGHTNLTKILTPDFTQGHPLRKDYVHIKDQYD